MKIAVVGTGYVGLVSGTCFAEMGSDVTCVDIDENKVQRLKNGEVPIYEPKLDILFERNISADRLHFTTSLADAVKEAQIVFLALPTPPGEDGSADLSYVLGVAEELGKILDKYTVIVNKSTVPVGTAEKTRAKIAENCKVEFDVVSNPEFLREGFAVDDFLKPDRVVIGTSSEKAKKLMGDLYKPFTRQGNPIYFMDEKSSELTKYAANSFLATKISFMNEIANVCELVGANVDNVRIGMGTDTRIGKRFLFPGIGYGGSCFPKDVKALIKSSSGVDYDFQILNAVENVNEKQKLILLPRIKAHFGGSLKGKKIALWGLAFKPNTDDIREAPAHYLIRSFLEEGATVSCYDPEAMANTQEIFGDQINYGQNYYEILEGADALVVATEWSVFRNPDFDKMEGLMASKVIFDGRNLFETEEVEAKGYQYFSIGR